MCVCVFGPGKLLDQVMGVLSIACKASTVVIGLIHRPHRDSFCPCLFLRWCQLNLIPSHLN